MGWGKESSSAGIELLTWTSLGFLDRDFCMFMIDELMSYGNADRFS